jgi:hypothetical protein
MGLAIAYLAQGKVWIKSDGEPARPLESPYGQTILDRAARSQQKHAWKSQGDGFLSGQVLWGKSGAPTGPAPVLFTSLSRGAAPRQVVYSLSSGSLCALCEADDLGAEERRLWNDNRHRVQHIHTCPRTGNLVCSVQHENGSANLGVLLKGEPGFGEVTEGDSVDTAPRWIPGDERRIVYQSAGVGRNREGHFLALGPFSIQALQMDTAEMGTLAEDPHTDFLSPQITEDGTLHYIRRPYNEHGRLRPIRALKDTLLLPFRLLYALFQFFNFFSMRYTGKKLSTPAGTPRRDLELKQMMIWGNLVEAQRQDGEHEEVDLVPSSWQLARRRPQGSEEVLAKGVLAYDIAANGTLACSNGNSIFLLHPDGRKERLLSQRMIEQVVMLET